MEQEKNSSEMPSYLWVELGKIGINKELKNCGIFKKYSLASKN